MYYHFEYASGGNPYIAKTEEERDRIIEKHESDGEPVTETKEGLYLVHDRQTGPKTEHIKANLPVTEQQFIDGYGEGVFILVDEQTKAAHDADETGAGYSGQLDNDSLEYIGLTHGAIVPLEMRGENRPVVLYSWLIEHYDINKEFFEGTPLYDAL